MKNEKKNKKEKEKRIKLRHWEKGEEKKVEILSTHSEKEQAKEDGWRREQIERG